MRQATRRLGSGWAGTTARSAKKKAGFHRPLPADARRVFYPIGFDDNGLPTERYVEQAYGVRAADTPRAEFVALCLAETQRTAERYEDLWRRLGLSLDWSLRYSTIDARCQRTAAGLGLTQARSAITKALAEAGCWRTACRCGRSWGARAVPDPGGIPD